jgi:hypothetical protein
MSAVAITALSFPWLTGCKDSDTQDVTGPKIASLEEIRPFEEPNNSAILNLAGMEIPVEVDTEMDGPQRTIALVCNGETIEQERYVIGDDEFNLAFAAGEQFVPPLPIMVFPMSVGEGWEWSGQLISSNLKQHANAKVVTESSRAQIDGRSVPSVKVSVKLQLEPKMERSLAFWIVEGKGVVRREFGDESVREPVKP